MNRLKELRNERKYSTKQVELLTGINMVSITHYENENRDINTDNLKILATLYNVSIDYILCYNDNGIYVYYENDDRCYSLSEKAFRDYNSRDLIYYKNNKRYLDMNKILNLNKNVNVSDLLEFLEEKKNMDVLFSNEETLNIKIPLKRFKAVEQFIKLDDEKFEAIKKMIELV